MKGVITVTGPTDDARRRPKPRRRRTRRGGAAAAPARRRPQLRSAARAPSSASRHGFHRRGQRTDAFAVGVDLHRHRRRRATRARRARRGTSAPRVRHVRALEHLREVHEERGLRDIAPTTVTSSRPSSQSTRSGVMCMPPAYGGAVADRDQPRLELVRLAVDGEPERVRLVDRERAQHRGDVERGAREPLHGVGPAVRLGVEAGRGDARVPATVDAAEVDDAVVDRASSTSNASSGCFGVVAELAGEVVARAGRHDRQAARRCRPRPPRPRRPDRRRRTRRDRAPSPRPPSRAAPARPARATPRPRRRRRSRRASISGSSFRVRPRPATGLTITVHGTAEQRSQGTDCGVGCRARHHLIVELSTARVDRTPI